MDLFGTEKENVMTEKEAIKASSTVIVFLVAILLLGTMVGYLIYSNNQMLTAVLVQNKQITCSVSLPNKNGVDLSTDAYDKGE